jgi:hypothetical protein
VQVAVPQVPVPHRQGRTHSFHTSNHVPILRQDEGKGLHVFVGLHSASMHDAYPNNHTLCRPSQVSLSTMSSFG